VEANSVWVKYTLGFADFQTAGTTKLVIVRSIPGLEFVHQVVANVTTNFTGPGIVGVSMQAKFDSSNIGSSFIGGSGNNGIVASDQGLTAKASLPNGTNLGLGSFTASKDVTITATSSGANLSALTAGSMDVWVNVSTLP